MQFDDIDGNTHTIHLRKRDYTGDSSYINGSDTPFTKILHEQGTGKFECIKPSEALMEILSTTAFEFSEFFDIDDREWQMMEVGTTSTNSDDAIAIVQLDTLDTSNYSVAQAPLAFGSISVGQTYEVRVRDTITGTVTAISGAGVTKNSGHTASSFATAIVALINANTGTTGYAAQSRNNDSADSYIEVQNQNTTTSNTIKCIDYVNGGAASSGNTFYASSIQVKIDGTAYIEYEHVPGETITSVLNEMVDLFNAASIVYSKEWVAKRYNEQLHLQFTGEGSGATSIVVSLDEPFELYTNGYTVSVEQQPTIDTTLTPKWIGYVLPGIYEEPHTGENNYIVRLRATDGLADLDSTPYTFDTSSKKVIHIIAECLSKTDLPLDIVSSCSIFEDNQTTGITKDPLPQTYLNSAYLTNMNCAEILKHILFNWNARILQIQGRWHIEDITLKTTSDYTYRLFSLGGTYKDNDTLDDVVDLGGTDDDVRNVDNSGCLRVISSISEVITKSVYGAKRQLLKNPTFALNDSGIPTGWTYYGDGEPDIQIGGGVMYWFREVGKRGLLEQEITVSALDDLGFKIILEYWAHEDENLFITIFGDDGTNIQWLHDDGTWSTSSDTIKPPHINCNASDLPAYLGVLQTFKLEVDNLPANITSIKIQIGQPSSDSTWTYTAGTTTYSNVARWFGIKSFGFYYGKLKVNDDVSVGIRQTSYYSANKANYRLKPLEYDVNFSDAPSISNATALMTNVFFLGDGTATSSWDSSAGEILDLARQARLKEYSKNSFVLTGTFEGNIGFAQVYKDTNNSNRYFMITGGEWDVKNNLITGEWIEIGRTPLADSIVSQLLPYNGDLMQSDNYDPEVSSTPVGGGTSNVVTVTLPDYALIEGDTRIEPDFIDMGSTGSNFAIDLDKTKKLKYTLTGDLTITIQNGLADKAVTLALILVNNKGSDLTLTWSGISSSNWLNRGDQLTTLVNGKTYVVVITSGGSTLSNADVYYNRKGS